jgi:SIR2-like domain
MSSALNSILNVARFRDRFDLLRRRIEVEPGKVVPWIGAGMSKPFGLPLWREFLEITSKRLEPEERAVFEQLDNLDNIDLSLVAEFLHSRLRGRLRQEVIERFNKSQRWSPKECIIPWLGVQRVITTNYDRILDSLLPWLTPVSAATAASDFQDIRCLIKLHGRVEEPDSIVLTRSQYVRAYTDRFWGWLRQFSFSNAFLFLGCSLTEDDFLEVLKPIGNEAAPRHFAIIPTKSNEESRERSNFLSRTYGIETISYDPDEHGHGVIRDLLLELVPPLRTAAKQIPKISNEAELELAWDNYKLALQRNDVGRKDKVEYLTAILELTQSIESRSVREDVFEELLKYWQDEDAWSALLETAKGSHKDTARVLQQRESLRPLFDENTQSLPESSDIPIRNYYRAFRAGKHVVAEKWLTDLKNRSTANRDRIAVLCLQNSLLAGNSSERLIKDFEKGLTNNGKHLYLDYGLGLFYLWEGALDRARKRFESARAPWPYGKPAFISWQEAICEILARDFMTARVKLEAVAVGAFLPLGPAGGLIRRNGGAELSMDLRRTTSKELYCLVWFLRSLAAKAMNLGDEASERHDSTVLMIESIQQEDDLLLDWLLYAVCLLKDQYSEPLRIELEHRTRQSPGIRVLLNAVNILLTAISPKAGTKYSASIAAGVGESPLTG